MARIRRRTSTRVRSKIGECMPIIQSYIRCKGKAKKAKFLALFEKCLLNASREMSYNTLHGPVSIPSRKMPALKRYKKVLRALASPRTSTKERKKILIQKGEGILPLLASLVIPAIGELIRSKNG